jgi:hypothetical protein
VVGLVVVPPVDGAIVMPGVARIPFMNLLLRLPERLAPADQRPLGILLMQPKRCGFTAGSQE